MYGLSIHGTLTCYGVWMRKRTFDARRGGESVVLGQRAFAAISAVEGLKLTPAGRKRVHGDMPIEQRRAEVLRAYTALKRPK
jgi:hypothetical protein